MIAVAGRTVMTGRSAIAVFDLGKTNSKLFVISSDGIVIGERRTKPEWVNAADVRVLDDKRAV